MHTRKVVADRVTKGQESFYIYSLFLLTPIFAVIIAAKNARSLWAKNIFWLFTTFYGFTFVIGNELSDVNRYKWRFEFISRQNFSFSEYMNLLIEESNLDFLQPLITYIISLFTSDFRVVLTVTGFMLGFFLSRNISYVLSYNKGKLSWYTVCFLLIFSFVYAVWDINVMRFTLAAQFFFYGAFRILIRKEKWGWLFIGLAPLMHFTFSLPLIVIVLFKIFGNRTTFYFGLYCLSFLISELNLDTIKGNLTFLPQVYQENSEAYLDEDYKEQREKQTEEKNFRGRFYQVSIKWGVAILLLLIYLKRKEWLIKEKAWYSYFSFTLLYLGIFNVMSLIPVMNRFLFTGYLFALSLFFVYFHRSSGRLQTITLRIAMPLLLFYFVVKLRIGLEFTGFYSILGNPISAIYNESDVALINFLK